jgi:hypothetical protein
MAFDAFNQSGEGSAAERCSGLTSAPCCPVRSSPVLVSPIRSVTTSSLSLPGRSLAPRTASRNTRGHGTGYLEAPPRHGGTAPQVREKQRCNYRSGRSCGIAGISAHSEKAWLSRVPRPAHFKFTFPIVLIACWSRSSCRRMTFWCPVASVPSVDG